MKWLIALGVLAVLLFGFVFLKLPQPIIEVKPEALFHLGPLAVTNTIFTSWLMILAIVLITKLGTRKMSLIPRGFQNFFEAVVEGFGSLANSVAGEANGRRFFPVVFILFLYIVFSNWFALLPVYNVIGLVENEHEHIAHEAEAHPNDPFKETEVTGYVLEKRGITLIPSGDVPYVKVEFPAGTTNARALALVNAEIEKELKRPLNEEDETFGIIAPFLRGVNTDVNAPLGYAIWSAIFVEFWGITALGLLGYGSKFFNFKRLLKGDILNGGIDVFVGFLELISEFARLISFTFRLFGNIFAGEVLLFVMAFLMPLLLVDVFYALELFVGLIQAFVFAILTLVFGVMAVSGHGDHESHDGSRGAAHGATHA